MLPLLAIVVAFIVYGSLYPFQFDFGRTDCDNAGLITFKDRWGSQRSELTYWRLSQNARSRGGWKQKLRFAEPIFACIPDRLLAASGRILYRHIG